MATTKTIEVRQQEQSKRFGIYENGTMVEGGFFSKTNAEEYARVFYIEGQEPTADGQTVAPCFFCGTPCAHPDDIYCSDQCSIAATGGRS